MEIPIRPYLGIDLAVDAGSGGEIVFPEEGFNPRGVRVPEGHIVDIPSAPVITVPGFLDCHKLFGMLL